MPILNKIPIYRLKTEFTDFIPESVENIALKILEIFSKHKNKLIIFLVAGNDETSCKLFTDYLADRLNYGIFKTDFLDFYCESLQDVKKFKKEFKNEFENGIIYIIILWKYED